MYYCQRAEIQRISPVLDMPSWAQEAEAALSLVDIVDILGVLHMQPLGH